MTYEFEGQQRTMAEIMAMVPVIKSKKAIRKHLDSGRRTIVAMMSYDPKAVSAAASRRYYLKSGRPAVLSGHVSGRGA